jgi:4-hydroxy-tetrahydrodipicolinate synthase
VAALWNGVAVALVTLFDGERAVDADATAAHAATLVGAGVRAVLVNGSTGEVSALTDAERADLVAAVRAACPGVPVLAGTSGEWWRPAADRAAAAVSAGADALLVAPPPRGGDLPAYYAAVSAAAPGVPLYAYHYPGVAGGAVPLDALPDLPVRGLKDSTGDPERLLRELAVPDWSGDVYTGSAALVGYAGLVGATGAIVAAANFAAEDCLAAWEGSGDAQRRLLAAHLAVRERFPHGLKRAVAERYGTSVTTRLG